MEKGRIDGATREDIYGILNSDSFGSTRSRIPNENLPANLRKPPRRKTGLTSVVQRVG